MLDKDFLLLSFLFSKQRSSLALSNLASNHHFSSSYGVVVRGESRYTISVVHSNRENVKSNKWLISFLRHPAEAASTQSPP